MSIDSIENHTFIADLICPGDTVIDLGMNEGRFAMAMINRYGVRVLGVEPVPEYCARMPRHPDLRTVEAAVTGGGRAAEIGIDASRCSSILSTLTRSGSERLAVRGIALAQLIEMTAAERVCLAKVDIEGAEFEMFDSTPDHELLRLDQITIEYHDFLDSSLHPQVRGIDARMRELGFMRICFSRGWTDVLYVNQCHRRRLGGVRKVKLVAVDKYARGAVRIGRRVLTGT